MILQALHHLTEYEELMGDPDFEYKPVAYLVRVGRDGRLLGIEGTAGEQPPEETKKKWRPRPKSFPVPRESGRTSGDRAFFLFDKSEYALGLDPADERPPAKLAIRSGLFRQRVDECFKATEDEAVGAVLQLLEDLEAGRQQVLLPEECVGNDLFAFVFETDEELVTNRQKVRDYWKSLRQGDDSDSKTIRCLVTGEEGAAAEKHSILKNVPGAVSSGVPLVSFNSKAFESYGWSGNENAMISRQAAESYATALQRLIHPAPPDPKRPGETLPRRYLKLGSATVVGYWAKDADDFLETVGGMLDANPEKVSELYRSIWQGREPNIDNPAAFYALTLSGSQGRVIVRGWFEATVGEVARHLARHFADLAIVRNTPTKDKLQPHLPLAVLLQSLAVLGKNENVPPHLASQLVEAALRGTPYPFSLLQRAVERSRAEIGKTTWKDLERRDARASLIKAVLNRRGRRSGKPLPEVQIEMDPNNTEEGYLLGRTMAVIERLQQLALGDVNASVVDRYFSAASATPQIVFNRLLRGTRHHARKAKDDETKRSTARWLENDLDALLVPFSPAEGGFPKHLNLEQQGLFILGYHHQRHYIWQPKSDSTP